MIFTTLSDAQRVAKFYGNGKVFRVDAETGILYAAAGAKRCLDQSLAEDIAAYCGCAVHVSEVE